MKPLSTHDLDGMQCSTPGCDCGAHDGEMWIHAKCHPDSPTYACYHSATGNLDITCAKCNQLVASIAVSGCEEKYDPWGNNANDNKDFE